MCELIISLSIDELECQADLREVYTGAVPVVLFIYHSNGFSHTVYRKHKEQY